VEIFHHYDSRASTENLELIILTQDYLKLESVTSENSLDHTYEVTNTTGRTVVKVGTSISRNFMHTK
jgi:Ser/Thr protein kinase RdoA (MazF antagonist)